jgi:hypothetical protein
MDFFLPSAPGAFAMGIVFALLSHQKNISIIGMRIEDMGRAALGMWFNKGSWYQRAPAAEYDSWLKVMKTISSSFILNPA